MKKIIIKHYKIIIGVIIGLIISVPVVYAAQTILSGNEVSYNNGTSGGSSNTVQGAIDELYDKVNSCKEYIPNDNPNRNIIKAYKYNEDSESDTYCVTGDEESCFITSCYDNKAKDSCPPGTIIDYKVNDNSENNIIRFHVVHDDGKVMTLQSQKDTVYNVAWYKKEGGISEGGECISCDNTQGPLIALKELEEKTKDWNNVNDLNYSIGDKDSTLGYSGCASDNSLVCNRNIYSIKRVTQDHIKSRMITVQEAKEFSCKFREKSCPIWMWNYLNNSMDYGGTKNDSTASQYYWIMSTMSYVGAHSYLIAENEGITARWTTEQHDVRAVVEINK